MNNIIDIPNIEEIAEVSISYGLIIVGTATIEGGTNLGDVLKIDLSNIQATASNTLPVGFKLKFKWYRNKELIEGAIDSQYVICEADRGCKISAEVISVEEGFDGTISTNEIAIGYSLEKGDF